MSHSSHVRILYKTVLKLHRGLPEDLRPLGTHYAREEFRRHKNCSQKEAQIFMQEWTKYALMLAEQLGMKNIKKEGKNVGAPLTEDEIEALNKDQIYQLYELMKASKSEL